MGKMNRVSLRGPEFKKLDRKTKRSITIMAGGKRMKVLDYLRQLAKAYPAMKVTETGVPVDHFRSLQAAYMAEGFDGVEAYDKKIEGVLQEAYKELYEENERLIAEENAKKEETTAETNTDGLVKGEGSDTGAGGEKA